MAKRRGHGEGSIFKRKDGKWVGELDLGRGPDGKRRRKTIYGQTRKEVQDRLLQLQAELRTTGMISDSSKLTLAAFLERWLESAAHTIRPSTLQSYRQYIRVHLVPTLGSTQLARLTPMQIQALYDELLAAGKARRTVQYIHAILRRALNQAVKWNMIPRNPAMAVDAPRPERREMTVLTPGQVEQLVAALQNDPLRALYYLALATGCRRGELIALRWSDIDWSRPAITIQRNAVLIDGKVTWSEPKTARSRRTVPLPAEAVTMLKAHRRAQLEERLQMGPLYVDHDLVFARPNGEPIYPSHITHHFARVVQKAGLHPVRLHDLRHTHATLLLAAGVNPKIVAERLGHSSVVMTLDTYSHVLPTMQDEVTRKLDALLPPSESRRL